MVSSRGCVGRVCRYNVARWFGVRASGSTILGPIAGAYVLTASMTATAHAL